MNSRELAHLVTGALDELKAENVVELDVRTVTDITDYMIIASGRSDRQVRALAENVVLATRRSGHAPLGVEGERDGQWILIDLCDVVLHVMQPRTRDFYQLEKLWSGGEESARQAAE